MPKVRKKSVNKNRERTCCNTIKAPAPMRIIRRGTGVFTLPDDSSNKTGLFHRHTRQRYSFIDRSNTWVYNLA